MSLYEDIRLIYDPITNRYRNVYPAGKDGSVQAIIQLKGICKYLGRFKNQQEAAMSVVKWYKSHFGGLWRRVLIRTDDHRKLPYVVSKSRRGPESALPGSTGWRVAVSVNGREVVVTPDVLGCYSEWWEDGLWSQQEAATLAAASFVKRFTTMKLERPVLFRI